MPCKNAIKAYVAGGYYHIYNRGVDKRIIYADKQDYAVFLSYLKSYLSPPPDLNKLRNVVTIKGVSFNGVSRQPKNYHKKVNLLAYCLMPNHFHLLIRQESATVMQNFMRSLATRYSGYFNKRHGRVGALFQGSYRAAMVGRDDYLLHLSRYIHLNPVENFGNLSHAYSSYADYLGLKSSKWVNPNPVLNFFDQATLPGIKGINTYKDFVELSRQDSGAILGRLTLED